MKHMIHISQLDRRFPTDEYGRPGLQLVQDSAVDEWLDFAGLHPKERTFGSLFLASLPGDFSDSTLVGIFGCDGYTPTIYDTLTTIWWGGELTQPFKDAGDYWRSLPAELEDEEEDW